MKLNEHNVQQFPVIELFGPTIQGEGSVIGMQTFFVRFGGCDYRCRACDSLHAVIPEQIAKNRTWMTAGEIWQNLVDLNGGSTELSSVTFSGGNPCIHDLTQLVSILNMNNVPIAVETQGTIWAEWLTRCKYVTISPKGPGMGEKFESEKFHYFIKMLYGHPGLAIKVVAFNADDLDFAESILKSHPELSGCFYLSVGNFMPPHLESSTNLVGTTHQEALLECYRLLLEEVFKRPKLKHARILPQMHVLLWGNKQGV